MMWGRPHILTPFPPSSPPSAAPSPQYSARTNRGSVVASFGPIHDITWEGHGGVDCTPKPFSPPERSLSRSYSFMFQRAADVREGEGGIWGCSPPFLGWHGLILGCFGGVDPFWGATGGVIPHFWG